MKNGYLSNVLSQIWQGKGRCKSSCILWCLHNSDKVSNLVLHFSQFSNSWLDLLNPWICKWPYKLWTFSKVFLQIGHVETSINDPRRKKLKNPFQKFCQIFVDILTEEVPCFSRKIFAGNSWESTPQNRYLLSMKCLSPVSVTANCQCQLGSRHNNKSWKIIVKDSQVSKIFNNGSNSTQ